MHTRIFVSVIPLLLPLCCIEINAASLSVTCLGLKSDPSLWSLLFARTPSPSPSSPLYLLFPQPSPLQLSDYPLFLLVPLLLLLAALLLLFLLLLFLLSSFRPVEDDRARSWIPAISHATGRQHHTQQLSDRMGRCHCQHRHATRRSLELLSIII